MGRISQIAIAALIALACPAVAEQPLRLGSATASWDAGSSGRVSRVTISASEAYSGRAGARDFLLVLNLVGVALEPSWSPADTDAAAERALISAGSGKPLQWRGYWITAKRTGRVGLVATISPKN